MNHNDVIRTLKGIDHFKHGTSTLDLSLCKIIVVRTLLWGIGLSEPLVYSESNMLNVFFTRNHRNSLLLTFYEGFINCIVYRNNVPHVLHFSELIKTNMEKYEDFVIKYIA